MVLSRLVYISEPVLDRTSGSALSQLAVIGASSRNGNAKAAITGALVYDDLWFLQTLEGDRASVWSRFRRIEDDERHVNVQLVDFRAVEDRMFGAWWMGVAIRNVDTEAIFRPYLRNGALRADTMAVSDILDLMAALARRGLDRGAPQEGGQRHMPLANSIPAVRRSASTA